MLKGLFLYKIKQIKLNLKECNNNKKLNLSKNKKKYNKDQKNKK